jgi:ribonuclease P protein component
MEHTLTRTERLGKKNFRRTKWIRSGRTPNFLLFKSKGKDMERRFGVVVSRKIKGAVRRNRIKRLLREFFRLNKRLFQEHANYSVRVMTMPTDMKWDSVCQELHLLVAKGLSKNGENCRFSA